MVTDPIADLITRIKTAGDAGKESFSVPYSKLKEAVLVVLEKEGYVGAISKKGKDVVKALEVTLKREGTMPRVQGVRRMSKLSKRVYTKAADIRSVRQGHGALILTTSQGIMTDKQARKAKVGGEPLFQIW